MCFRLPIHYFLYAACCSVSITTETDWHFAGPNIALNKSASQKPGTLIDGGSTSEGYYANLAVDGNDDNDFSKGSCSHTTASHYHQYDYVANWTVDLGGQYYISGIIIVNRKAGSKGSIFGHILNRSSKGFGMFHVEMLIKTADLRERLKGFLIFGFQSMHTCPNDGWCKMYDDKEKQKYRQSLIKIPFDGSTSFSQIAINLPGHQGAPEGGVSYLTLCEVKVYAISCKYVNFTNGRMILHDAGKRASIVCNKGFKPQNQNITCNRNKEWTYYNSCSPVYCAYPEKPIGGKYLMENHAVYPRSALPYSSVITAKCDIGYRSENIKNRTCQNDGTWSGEAPVCKKLQCFYPGAITNGEYRFKNGSVYESGSSYYNTTIQVFCNTGYRITGSTERTCSPNQNWSGETNCNLVTCLLPQRPLGGSYGIKASNGSFIPYKNKISNYSYEIYTICPKGNFLNSTSSVRRCLKTGRWSGEMGKCILVTCTQPMEIKNGFYNYTKTFSSGKAPYNTILTAVCEEHFQLVSPENKTRRCTETGVWDKEPALCVKRQAQSETSKAGLIGGTVSVAGLLIVITFVALFLLYRRRKRRKDNTEGSMRYRDVKKESASKRSSNSSGNEYAEVLQSNHVDMPQDGTPRVALGKKPAGPNSFTEYSYAMPEQVIPAVVSSSSLQSDREYYSFLGKEKIPATAIKIQDLSDITLNETGAKERFQKEFKSLSHGMVEAHKDALKQQNRGKNRYKNLYAYDDTRVILDVEDELDSDYINACFVHGFNKTRMYIASQGPTEEILNDFWKMIWQTECCKIVMLTNLSEEGKVKCEQYWPDHGSQTYGKITVKMKHTEPFSQFVIRTFTLQKDGSQNRIVTQFHFTAWPDRDVPKYASSMVHFLSKVKYSPAHGDGPIVVHCSAGVGRTGAFIALDNVIEQGKAMGYVDVAGVVESMRKQRVNSVQTLEQYMFVYQAVTEALMLSTSAMPAAKFPEAYEELLEMDMKKKKRKLNLKFEALKKMSPVAEESQYVSSTLVRNRNKNRYSNVLPVEEYIPSLTVSVEEYMPSLTISVEEYMPSLTISVEEYMPSLTKGDGSEDCEYINAVFLPSYKEKKAFIITQTPLESTVEDFWRLIWEHDVHTLIMMNNQKEMAIDKKKHYSEKLYFLDLNLKTMSPFPTNEKCDTTDNWVIMTPTPSTQEKILNINNSEVYWPNDDQTVSFGNMSITNDSTTKINGHTVLSLTIKKFVVTRHIRLFQVGGWKPHKSLPESTDVILSLMELIQSWQQMSENHIILVHCMNGVEKSGLFCVISAVIERMKIEQDVAIPQVIEEMRNAREQIIPTVEQFQFCHEAVLAFLHQYDTYSNFTL